MIDINTETPHTLRAVEDFFMRPTGKSFFLRVDHLSDTTLAQTKGGENKRSITIARSLPHLVSIQRCDYKNRGIFKFEPAGFTGEDEDNLKIFPMMLILDRQESPHTRYLFDMKDERTLEFRAFHPGSPFPIPYYSYRYVDELTEDLSQYKLIRPETNLN